MKKELHILLIEDDAADVFRINRELTKAGLAFRLKHVENEKEFVDELQHHPPDLVLSDHGLPSFNGFAALDIVQKRRPEVPFIFVTGSIDPGLTVEMFESGAADYVYKNRLSDLVPAMQQALRDAEERGKGKQTETGPQAVIPAPQSPTVETKVSARRVSICSKCKKVRDENGRWQRIEDFFVTHAEVTVALALCPDCARTGQRE